MLAIAIAGSTGCYWSKYDKLARTHVQLLLAMAEKLDAVTREEGAPLSSLAEYRYPLERARDFLRIVSPRFGGRPSLAALARVCDAYQDVLRVAESVRSDAEGRGPMELAEERLRAAASAALAALDAEGR
jgi:hypothetical protein